MFIRATAGRHRGYRASSRVDVFAEHLMPYSPLRLLALAIASIMTLSVAAPADAAKKKTQRQSAPQSRAAK
ncbi:hypothetical protein, partial [Stenotrophomonas sp.]|uniref:hypothetical protein n=1 Tax=Stenotrophomonas sp. TaxID=69392 RepID=UPI0028AE2426